MARGPDVSLVPLKMTLAPFRVSQGVLGVTFSISMVPATMPLLKWSAGSFVTMYAPLVAARCGPKRCALRRSSFRSIAEPERRFVDKKNAPACEATCVSRSLEFAPATMS
jgi:hypothetical protein